MEQLLQIINRMIWDIPVLSLILVTGLYLSIRTGFLQIRLFPRSCNEFINSLKTKNKSHHGISGYRALCTALAATVGTGNIVGIAGAIAIGGPGVVFWMWICALLGMIIKFAEVVLAILYREKGPLGEWLGGPMYMIKNGLPQKFHFLASVYAFFGIVAAFGIGNATQVNAIVGGLHTIASTNGRPLSIYQSLFIGAIIALFVVIAFRQGASGIGSCAEKLVPPAAVIYILLSIVFLTIRAEQIPFAVSQIFAGAFSPKSATCGIVSSFLITMRVGASRGLFTNEAGMGTASIAHSGADIHDPVSQGLLGSMEVFIDTIVMCTLTAFVILCSGVPISYGIDLGISLTMNAFTGVLGNWSKYLIAILVCIFAFATILGWGLYGMRCAQFLFGASASKHFIYMQLCAVIVGAVLNTSSIWLFSEIVNGLMTIPNLISIYLLFPSLESKIRGYPSKRAYSQ